MPSYFFHVLTVCLSAALTAGQELKGSKSCQNDDLVGPSDEAFVASTASVQMLQQQLKLQEGDGNRTTEEMALLQMHASVAHPIQHRTEGLLRDDPEQEEPRPAEKQKQPRRHRPRDLARFMERDHRSTWCGYTELPGFITALVQEGSDDFMLDITNELSDSGVVRFLVTAMAVTGTYSDSGGYLTQYAYPQEDSQSTMFEFRRGLHNGKVDVYYPQVSDRTSDTQYEEALRKGKGSGWYDELPIYSCSSGSQGSQTFEAEGEGSPQRRDGIRGGFGSHPPSLVEIVGGDGEEKQKENDKQPEQRVIINGGNLLIQGFYSTSMVANALSHRLLDIKAFPNNLDITAEFAMPDGFPMSVGFSLVKLPAVPMAPRVADDRLLYFTQRYRDLGYHHPRPDEHPSQSVDRHEAIIWRYDLSSLPNHQIRVHVDPSVPQRWREPFRNGIEQWNLAFSELGLRHAVKGVVPGDPEWPADYDVADARYNTISWVVTNQVVSMGIAKVDPRSGQIMKSDITMSDGWVRSFLGDLDLVAPGFSHKIEMNGGFRQESLLDTGDQGSSSRKSLTELAEELQRAAEHGESAPQPWGKKLSLLSMAAGDDPLTAQGLEDLLGIGLTHIVAHETGHILGLRHNFKGSLGISFDCTRNASCATLNSLSASVMDYVPTNPPPTSNVGVGAPAFVGIIGAYDKLAIRYGYMNASDSQPDKQLTLVPEIRAVLEEAEQFEVCYDSDTNLEDPSCAPYDMSDDPLRFFEDQLDRLAMVQRNLLQTSVLPGAPYSQYGEAVLDVLSLVLRHGSDAANWIGGVTNHYAYRRADGRRPPVRTSSRRAISADYQRRALNVVLRAMRPGEYGLLPSMADLPFLVRAPHGEGSIATLDIDEKVRIMGSNLMNSLLSSTKLKRMHDFSDLAPDTNGNASAAPLNVAEYLTLLVNAVMPLGADGGLATSNSEHWDLHNNLVKRLTSIYHSSSSTSMPEAVIAAVLKQLRTIHDQVDTTLSQASNRETGALREHWLNLRQEVVSTVCGTGVQSCVALQATATRSSANSLTRSWVAAAAGFLTLAARAA